MEAVPSMRQRRSAPVQGDIVTETTHTNDPSTGEHADPDETAAPDQASTTGDPTATDHPTGEDQAAENEANESPA